VGPLDSRERQPNRAVGLMIDQGEMPRCNTRYIDRIDREVGTVCHLVTGKNLI